ncbi:hypothetical protein ACP70R_038183 [Stipagrostis hirtigluma subsp. patula]
MADIDDEAFFRGTTDENAVERPTGWSRSPWEKGVLIAKLVLAAAAFSSMFVVAVISNIAFDTPEATKFSMELAGFEGLNATIGHTVSPAFRLKVHAEDAHVLLPWCYNGGEVLVSYSNVALAWGHVPRFCMKRRVPTELTVVPWGRGIGLPENLRRRLDSERHMGTAKVMADMKLFYSDKDSSSKYHRPSLHSFQLMLRDDDHTINN